ncbi:MAG: hypothetical protein WAZ94_11330 [Phycisphaerales bacterium]
MTGTQSAAELEHEMVADPERFAAEGKAYALLQHYFAGRSLAHLSPLMRSPHPLVKRAVIFVLSELGQRAEPLVEEVLPLARDADRLVRYQALEVIAVCARGDNAALTREIGRALDDTEPSLEMGLLVRLDVAQLGAAYEYLQAHDGLPGVHLEGFALLLAPDAIDDGRVESMLTSATPALRRYAAVAVARSRHRPSSLIAALTKSEDGAVRRFTTDMRLSE